MLNGGVQLLLAYSWAGPASLVAGKDGGGMFLISSVCSLSFIFLFLHCPSLSPPLLSLLSLFYLSPVLSLLSLFSLSLGDNTK